MRTLIALTHKGTPCKNHRIIFETTHPSTEVVDLKQIHQTPAPPNPSDPNNKRDGPTESPTCDSAYHVSRDVEEGAASSCMVLSILSFTPTILCLMTSFTCWLVAAWYSARSFLNFPTKPSSNCWFTFLLVSTEQSKHCSLILPPDGIGSGTL